MTHKVTASTKTEITAKQLSDSMVVINPSSYTYTGGKIIPTYAVIDGAIALYKKEISLKQLQLKQNMKKYLSQML